MNEIDTSVQSRLTRLSVRRTLLFVLLTQVLYTVLYAFVLNPLYTHFASDVLYKDAWWLNLIGVAIDATTSFCSSLCTPPRCMHSGAGAGGRDTGCPCCSAS